MGAKLLLTKQVTSWDMTRQWLFKNLMGMQMPKTKIREPKKIWTARGETPYLYRPKRKYDTKIKRDKM